ncbi:MAG: hypothetical protein ABFD69_05095 [Candidatus Sumerlaeia bacterium]
MHTFHFEFTQNPILFIFPLFIILIIAAGIYSAIQNRRRREALFEWATMHGLNFDMARQYGFEMIWGGFQCLRQGDSDDRYAYNMITGQWQGFPLTAFDYHYETHTTDSKGRRHTNDHYFSAAILGSPVPLKPLLIRPEGFFDKIGEFFGHDDIDFESAEFSRRFFVKAEDRKWAYDVLHARAIEFLLARPSYCIQFDARGVIVWSNALFSADEFESAIETVLGLLEAMPDYLVKELANPAGEVN